jgi:hypothetical protein
MPYLISAVNVALVTGPDENTDKVFKDEYQTKKQTPWP